MPAAPTTELEARSGTRALPLRAPSAPPRRSTLATARIAAAAQWWLALLLAGVLCWITFYAKGGLNLETMTTAEIALTIGSGVLIACVALLAQAVGRPHGLWAVGLLLAFAVLSGISVAWSVQPDDSWRDAGRLLAYGAVFAAAVTLVRVAPERWPAVLGGLALAAVAICGFALLTKVFPGKLASNSAYARLEEPYGYWNALGLSAALGAVCCMWLGARRAGHALASALAYPALGLLLLTLMLAYSRGALAALAIGLLLWFCVVPLRLRSAALLIVSALAAGAVAAWSFSRHALSAEAVPLAARAQAGHRLGALIVAMLLVLTAVGLAVGFSTARRAPRPRVRRKAGIALVALIALSVAAFAGALAHSHRGLGGSVSHAVDALTNPNAKPPPNTPSRLTAVASVRARYWKEALKIFSAHPALGTGAATYQTARMRYRTETLEVRHAHGFVVQTLSDLGLVGLAVALALLASWLAAAGRPTHPFNRRWSRWSAWRELRSGGGTPGWHRSPQPYTPERIGMLAMLCLVVVFGVHSLVDWTWYVPGDACAALLCAGWLAGRGELSAPSAPPLARAARRMSGLPARAAWRASGLPALVRARSALLAWRAPASNGNRAASARARLRALGPTRVALACAAIAGALLAAWSQWQPQRAEDARQEALVLAAREPAAAAAAARAAVARDPLSAEALLTLAHIQLIEGSPALARATLQRAVRLQPSNPQTWLALGRNDLLSDPAAAVRELQAAIYLNPESIAPEALARERAAVEIYNQYIGALRASQAAAARSASAPRTRAAPGARGATRRGRAPRSARSGSPRAGA